MEDLCPRDGISLEEGARRDRRLGSAPPQAARRVIENFNGGLCEECLNRYWLQSLADAMRVIESWENYNNVRLHSSLEGCTPRALAEQHKGCVTLLTPPLERLSTPLLVFHTTRSTHRVVRFSAVNQSGGGIFTALYSLAQASRTF